MISWALLATLAASADAPDSYAVTGARILTGTGAVIEKGTLVVDDGLVVGVGERLEALARVVKKELPLLVLADEERHIRAAGGVRRGARSPDGAPERAG